MAVDYNPRTVTDGLVLALDAANTKSYDNPTITYVGGTSDSNNSSSFTLSGLQSGDLVLYFSAEDTANVATPTGASWTAIPGLITQPDNDNIPNSAAFYVFATGTSVTASGLNTGNENVRVMIAFRNVNPTNPFDVNATENSGSGLPNPPSITPVTDNCMIVAVGLLDDHAIANSISPPTGYTTAVNMDSDGGANDTGGGAATIMTAYKLLATAAAEDPDGFTGTTGDPNKGITIALREATNPIWTDLSGQGNNATNTSFSEVVYNSNGWFDWTDGPGYDSTQGCFTLPNDSFTLGNNFTIEIWNYYDSSTDPDTNPFSGPNLWTNSANYDWNIGAGNYNGLLFGFNSIRFFSTINTQQSATYNPIPSLQTWHQHVLVADNNTSGTVYVDGNSVATLSAIKTYGQSNGALGIGIADKFGFNYRGEYNGYISIVRVYLKALTQEEILQNFNALRGRYGI